MKRWVRTYLRERDAAVLSFDVNKFRHFYHKWTLLGVHIVPLGNNNDDVEILIRKMVLIIKKAPESKKAEARQWLSERGYL